GENMPDLPLKLWVGGVQAKVLYQGRSGCCIGQDQIVFTVPDDAPAGCAVPIAVEITPNITQISNNVRMPIAIEGRDCTPGDPALGSNLLQQAVAAKSARLGFMELDHFLNNDGAGFRDIAQFGFANITFTLASPLFALSSFDRPPLGTCIAAPRLGGGDN